MKIVQKVALFAVLLIFGFQLSAKNKDRVWVVNNYGSDICVRPFYDAGSSLHDHIIKKRKSGCVVDSNMNKIQVSETTVRLKGIYAVNSAVQAGNVIVVTKKEKYTPRLKVYKSYDTFIAANPDYQLDPQASCPHVLP